MTTENRGGPRVPDGKPRPASLPLARGPNRSDLSELPGSPGTPLPGAPGAPVVSHGQAGPARKALGNIPMPVNSQGQLNDDSMAPDEPVTAGIAMGPGAGPESLIPSQGGLTSRLTAEQMQYAYPLIMRLATLPNSTSETKIMAQRIRASLPVRPEQMPILDPSERPKEGKPGYPWYPGGTSDRPKSRGEYPVEKRPQPTRPGGTPPSRPKPTEPPPGSKNV